MNYFASVNPQNVVEQVVVVSEDASPTEDVGVMYLQRTQPPSENRWIQTWRNGGFRKNAAGVHYTYDGDLRCFVPPQPEAPAKLNSQTCRWVLDNPVSPP